MDWPFSFVWHLTAMRNRSLRTRPALFRPQCAAAATPVPIGQLTPVPPSPQ